ncbi:MAG: SulP family inorganic anion transporter [Oscillospiraceae bacterium]|nr:SulP family inorganic anion transporter [Oscillospiraceae bacterium]
MLAGASRKTLPRDIFTGIIIALVSIPISMGYAQIAGLPAVCGLYGSIFPILIFALGSKSPQFIFGVDAAPAALVGSYLAAHGIAAGSAEAAAVVPVITLFTGLWLILFAILKAGRLAAYISTPVMGGFISGICTTIILMQIPKLLGGSSGTGELPELLRHMIAVCRTEFHPMSLAAGGIALAVLLLGKKLAPKLPMAVFVMAAGAVLGMSGLAERCGIRMLEAAPSGLPAWHLPSLTADGLGDILTTSLAVAAVIMTETLLATHSFGNKNGYSVQDNREILIYGLCNLSACLTGCCPVNGSVSRTAMGEQYGGKSQVMSLTASVTMAGILLFCTGFIGYLPVPVLTAIVISALLGAVEFDLAHRLLKQDKRELLIFLGAFAGVLFFGTVAGVVIGVILSFVELTLQTANPKRSFLGVIPGHEGFHSLERNTYAEPIRNVILYRFSSNLYFANVHLFINDLEAALRPDTKCIVVDSGAVCNLDITAADRIEAFRKTLNERGISLYFASHIGTLNDRFRQLGLHGWIEHGYVRRTIPAALRNAGFAPPYVTASGTGGEQAAGNPARLEFEWAFGADASAEIEQYAESLLESIDAGSGAPPEVQLAAVLKAKGIWHDVSDSDQEELLTHLQAHIRELSERLHMKESEVEEAIEARRMKLALRLMQRNPKAAERIRAYNREQEEVLRDSDPALYAQLMQYRRESLRHLSAVHPEYAGIIRLFYENEEIASE